MRKYLTSLKIVITIILIAINVFFSQAQTILHHSVNIINDIAAHPRVFKANAGFGKTGSCGVDTVNYTYNKVSAFQSITLNASTSGSIFAQFYPVAGAITVSGFEFFAWQAAGTSTVVTLTCKIYSAGADSMPSGSALRSVSVNVDSTFGGGLLSVLRKKANFSSPLTTSSAYVITVETSSSVNVAVVSNSWTASPQDGRSEWLSSVKIGSSFVRSYNVTIGTSPPAKFNADFIF